MRSQLGRVLLVTFALLAFSPVARADGADDAFAKAVDLSPLRTVAVQHRQTLKTLDSYARQTISAITGHSSIDGHDAIFSILDIAYHPDDYAKLNLIKIRNVPLRQEFRGLKLISSDEAERIVHDGTISLNLWMQDDVQQMLRDVMASDTRKSNAVDQAAEAAGAMSELCRGTDPFVPVACIPPATNSADDHIWHTFSQTAGNSSIWTAVAKQNHGAVIAPLPNYAADRIDACVRYSFLMMQAWRDKNAADVNSNATALAAALEQVNPAVYPPMIKRQVEVVYNRLAKMTLPGAAFYFLAFVLFLAFARSGVRSLHLWGLRFFAIGFLIHTIGIAIRWWLVGSIPIKNQFESVMFSAWFGCAVGLILELRRPRGIFGAGASFVGWLSLVAIFCAPFVFGREIGGEIGQVNGVLMSYWLYIHVTAVTASYSLIGTAFLLSAWWLIRYYRSQDELGDTSGHRLSADAAEPDLRDVSVSTSGGGAVVQSSWLNSLAAVLFIPGATKTTAKPRAALPVAEKHRVFLANLDACNLVVLQLAFWILGAGIIFGAIWADESWGRPWGWDPKETFALVTWIVYLIVVHVRVATEDKAWWTAVLSVIGFFIMLFNWIGVNFFLVGLHSYA
ncbi:MAG TPA: cytochrome c biogenesis protein CcsA [Tepidisphaeraceae bacterium]|nr:cytochrome c biogenesis protein CcsA [Tepidisphaeraceae bacterium]